MSVVDALEFDQARLPPLQPADTRPPPSVFHFDWQANEAAAEQAYHDVGGTAQRERAMELALAASDLAQLRGLPRTHYYASLMGEPVGTTPPLDEDRFWRDLAETRRTRPDALKDLGRDRADYDKRLTARFQAGAADRQRRMARGGFFGNLPGGVVGGFSDPINLLTMGIGGGGRSVAAQIVRNGLLNATIEGAEQPIVALERQQQGGELTAEEAGFNVLGAGIGGGLLTGAGIGAARGLNKVFSLDDRALAKALRDSTKGDWQLTPDQAAALHVLDRAGEIDATNPYPGTYAALDLHARRVDEVLAAMARLPEASSASGGAASVAPTPTRGTDAAYAAVVGIEGGTNRDGSFRTSPAGAIGPAQMMPGTAPIAARLAGLPFDPVRLRSDARYNLALGRAYYDDLLRQFGGDMEKAAAAYNTGPGNVRKALARAEAAGSSDWVAFLPFKETRDYVANFRRRMGGRSSEPVPVLAEGGDAEIARPAALDAERPDVFAEPLTLREDALQAGLEPVLRQMAEDGGQSLNRVPALAEGLGVDEAQLRRALDRLVDQGTLRRTAAGQYRRPADTGPEDMLRFITRHGGLSYDGLDPKLRDVVDAKGHDLRNTGNLATMVPGGGPLLRPNGRSLDEMGELLWDAGYFGPPETTPRPTEGELITLLDDSIRTKTKRYSSFDQAPEPEARASDFEAPADAPPSDLELEGARRAQWDQAAEHAGMLPPLPGEIAAAERIMRQGTDTLPARALDPLPPPHELAPYLVEMVNREIADVRAAEMEAEHGLGAALDELEADGALGPPMFDEAAAKAFDDPAGDGAEATAESLWHDIRMAGEEGQAQLIDLDDGKGPRTIADIEEELALDAKDIDTIESCLVPPALPGGGA